jgi:hypothetical protein
MGIGADDVTDIALPTQEELRADLPTASNFRASLRGTATNL